MTATVAQVLSVARKYLGVREDPPRSNCQRFSASLGRPCEPWCADFVAAVSREAGLVLPSTSAYTPSMAAGFRRDGRWGSRPAVGAFVFFQWPSMGRIAHVGIVEAVNSDGAIVTIEGNTDAAGGRTGGRVKRHVRRVNIAGYGYPRYAATRRPPGVKPPVPEPESEPKPKPEPVEDDPVPLIVKDPGSTRQFVVAADLSRKVHIATAADLSALEASKQYVRVVLSATMLAAIPGD